MAHECKTCRAAIDYLPIEGECSGCNLNQAVRDWWERCGRDLEAFQRDFVPYPLTECRKALKEAGIDPDDRGQLGLFEAAA
jgi:hypothetical protein